MEFSDQFLEAKARDKSRFNIVLLRLFEVHWPIVSLTMVITRPACCGLWCQDLFEQCPKPTLLHCSDCVVMMLCCLRLSQELASGHGHSDRLSEHYHRPHRQLAGTPLLSATLPNQSQWPPPSWSDALFSRPTEWFVAKLDVYIVLRVPGSWNKNTYSSGTSVLGKLSTYLDVWAQD